METWIRHYRQLTESQDREQFLDTVIRHYAKLFDATDSAYVLLDDQMRVLSHNELARRLLGRDLVMGEPLSIHGDLSESESDDCDSVIEQSLDSGQPDQHHFGLRSDGDLLWVRMTVIPMQLMSDRQALVILQDISARKQLEANVQAQQEMLDNARTRDPLTGLHNRRFILEELDHLNAKAKRYGTGFSLALIDLDYFKSVNDTYGHQIADEVLQILARLLEKELRDADISARYGEEEFMVLLPETSAEDAVHTINRLRQLFTETRVPGIRRSLTLSAGVMQWEPGLSLEQLVFKTDQRLTMAKYAGRNQVCGELY